MYKITYYIYMDFEWNSYCYYNILFVVVIAIYITQNLDDKLNNYYVWNKPIMKIGSIFWDGI
jgi:hypothetical protein